MHETIESTLSISTCTMNFWSGTQYNFKNLKIPISRVGIDEVNLDIQTRDPYVFISQCCPAIRTDTFMAH